MAAPPNRAGEAFSNCKPLLDALAQSEAKYRTLVDKLPDAIIVHVNGRIVFANDFCARLLGAATPDHLIGRDIVETIHPDSLPIIRERIAEHYRSGASLPPMEHLMVTLDGSLVDVEAVAVPIKWNGDPAIEVVLRDISQRKQAEVAATESQKRLELAQRAGLRIGLWDWEIESNSVSWSDETYRQFGFTRDTFSGNVQDAVDRVHPEDVHRLQTAIDAVMSGGVREYSCQYRVLRPDATVCWIDAHGVLVQNGSRHMIGIGVDITDLKQSEEYLQESQDKYRLLLNSTAEAIYGIDLNGDCTFCNPACARLLGYDFPEDLLGKNMHQLMHHTRADGSLHPDDQCAIYLAVREGKSSHVTDEVLWRSDGTSFAAEYWSYPMRKSGKTVGAVVTFLDISARKHAEQALRQSEARYRQLFENATYGIYLSKPDGSLIDANPALVKMLGYDSREELLRLNLERDIYDSPVDRREIIRVCQQTGRVDGIETRWRRKDGKTIEVRISGGLETHDNHFEVIVDDITEQKNTEAQLRQSQKMEAIGLLAGGIAHDFNNLLSVIIGSVELFTIKSKPGYETRHLEEIRKASERAAQLTGQLLAFSRKSVVHPIVLDLNTVILDLAKILQRLIGEDIRIHTDLDSSLGSVRADRGQMEQILLNLATNARDAMPDGGTLTIRTKNCDLAEADAGRQPLVPAGSYVRISVSDTGMGMTEEVRARIFEPFFTTKPQGRGTGLGLATVYGVVKQSNGHIGVDSTPGVGTSFEIYLPRTQEHAVTISHNFGKATSRGNATILLLEDEEPLRKLVAEILTMSGYKILAAQDGNHAFDLAQQFTGAIPLIISDVVLTDVNGPTAVQKIRSLHPESQVLYMSGYADAPVAQQLVEKGAVLLQKPVTRKELLLQIDELLQRKTSRRET